MYIALTLFTGGKRGQERPTPVFSGNTPGMPYLTWVMSKFLNLGFTLEQVVAMATVNPARVIGRLPKLGTLELGAPGDVSVLELVEGVAGVSFGRPYNSPFSVR